MIIKEDIPTNNASSGNIAGIGSSPSDPPVKKKKKLKDILRRKSHDV